MHRATSEDAYTKAWFHYCRSIFPQSVRKASPDVDFYNGSTYQCSIIFNNMVSFNKKSEFRKAENTDKPISSLEKFNVTNDPHLSLLTEFWWKQLRTCDLDSRGWQPNNRCKGITSWLWLCGMPFEQKQWSVSSRQNWFIKIYSTFMGINVYRNGLWSQNLYKDKSSNWSIARAFGWTTLQRLGVCCISCGRQRIRYIWGLLWADSELHHWHQEETTCKKIWSVQTEMLCVPSPPHVGVEFTCCCSRILRNNASISVSLQGWCHWRRCQRRSIQVRKSTKICTIPQLQWC